MNKFLSCICVMIALLLVGSATAEAFDGFEGVIIIGEDNMASDSTKEGPGEGLEVNTTSVEIQPIEEAGEADGFFDLFVNITITNWTTGTLDILDSLSATITYESDYVYDGQVIFDRDSIGMVEKLSGKLAFRVPYIVAMAKQDELELKIISLGVEQVEAVDTATAAAAIRKAIALPFTYDYAVKGLAINFGDAEVMTSQYGEISDSFAWIVLDVQLMNWEHESLEIMENVQASLTFRNQYSYTGEFSFDQEQIDSLACCNGQIVIKVPYLVAFASKEELSLSVTLLEDSQSINLDLETAARELRKTVKLPFELDSAASTALQMEPGDAVILDEYNGIQDDVAKYIEQEVYVINWNQEEIYLDEEAITGYIAYYNTYAFPGEFLYPQTVLEPLEAICCQLVVRVPLIVTEAALGDVELWLTTEGYEYKDVFDVSKAAKNNGQVKTASQTASNGGTIQFGHYEQDNNPDNGKEPIEWIVLEKQAGTMLLMSKYGLVSSQYNDIVNDVTWETCSLRKWLNSTFLDDAFSEAEQKNIIVSNVEAHNNIRYGTGSGSETQDKVYILSDTEVQQYLTDETLLCEPTDYMARYKEYVSDKCRWWLRSSGLVKSRSTFVDNDGVISELGEITTTRYAVRPVICIKAF